MGNLVHAEPAAELLAVIRLRRGVVGECRRVSHIVPLPARGPIPEELVALCGAVILPAQAEVLDGIAGMPCEACLARQARRACRYLA
ncbi:hypothetical protein FHX82_002401 [Amycolatopsis bartoniae]|uniref:Uncharacterized protein n=1 Tax=Amycolatopsis bartoniae TaxID=941986 RepID=A0A8H9J1Z5_9PSEU|nr:hypothetical protein [Amycolatopsis bartoniae]MBB2935347.1 hypothetical protein [Amycolatopsis bartoniae]TVS99830.1 hypothetical protein FNH07_33485 [Amycolatopsis bartoniae]GHF85392.1 hypothetical protein GCM10017566_69310 [Amycolatopsis bartoniae]